MERHNLLYYSRISTSLGVAKENIFLNNLATLTDFDFVCVFAHTCIPVSVDQYQLCICI